MIALINPNVRVEIIKKLDISTPPLGLGYLASVLRQNGFKVKIVDDVVEKLNPEELVKKIKDAFLVGITSTTPTFKAALNYAKIIKEKIGSFIVLGGVHVTFKPEEALKHEFVDAVCIGEGERTIVELAERVEEQRNLEVKGVWVKQDGKIIKNEPRKFIEDLDSLPFPAFDLTPLEKYTLLGKKLEHFPIITSRGCPFSCRYCSSSVFMGKKFRARSAKNVVDEIEWLVSEFKAKHIAFGDDTFTLKRQRVEEICKEMKERNLDVTWSCSSRVDTIDDELLKLMRSAGCVAIYYGIETPNQKILEYYKKKISIEKAINALKATKKAGIAAICSFIIGAPNESKKEMEETLRFALKLDPDYAQFSILTPYPGTEIYEEAKEKNLLLSEDYEDFTAAKPVLKNYFMSPKEISAFLRECYLRFYLRPKFILREMKKGNVGVIVEIIKRALRS